MTDDPSESAASMTRREFLKKAGQWLMVLIGYSLFRGRLGWASVVGSQLAIDDLKNRLGANDAVVISPDDPAYPQHRQICNRRILTMPAVIVVAKTVDAVSKSVVWSRDQNLSVRARCGGHSYEGSSLGSGTVIDVRPLNQVIPDTNAQTVRVGAGTLLSEISAVLSPLGFAVPAGSCPTVGISGLTLGGGFGLLSRKWGLTVDQLISFQMIDAQGRLVTASAAEHPDLFWACRGGGGQFGVITEFTFHMRPLSQVATFSIQWSTAQTKDAMLAWQRFAPQAPDELTCHLTLSGSAQGGLGAPHCGGQVGGKETGQSPTQEEVLAMLKPLTDHVPPVHVSIRVRDYASAVKHFAGDDGNAPVYFKGKSDFAMTPLSAEGVDTVIHQLSNLPSGGVAAIWDSFGGAISRVAPEATAFAHRDALFDVQYYTQWSTSGQTEDRLTMMRNFHDALRPYFSRYAYSNYADADLKDWAHAYYGKNVERLIAVKTAYDPTNLFDLGLQGLKPRLA